MNLKAFLVDALGSALDVGLGSPEDVLRHVTPDVLAQHLPRPLWARLLTACLGASKVDAELVVGTIGVPNLVEHVPDQILWSCISEIATRALGGVRAVAIPVAPEQKAITPAKGVPVASTPARGVPVQATPPRGVPLAPPPPANDPVTRTAPLVNPAATSRSIPSPQSLANLDLDDEPAPPPQRARTPTGQRFRQSQTGIARMGAATAARRPQAQAAPSAVAPGRPVVRRGATEAEVETETHIEKDWSDREIAVDDEQLVDWQSSEETVTSGDGLTRKR